MTALEGQLLAPAAPQLHTSPVWVDVLTGQHVRVELRESTLPPAEQWPEGFPDALKQAQRDAGAAHRQRMAEQYGHPPTPGHVLTPEELARVFGQRHGGSWRPADPRSW